MTKKSERKSKKENRFDKNKINIDFKEAACTFLQMSDL